MTTENTGHASGQDAASRDTSAGAAKKRAKTPDKPRRKRRWPRRLLIAAALLLILYTLGGFFGVPAAVTNFAGPFISERINGRVEIGSASFNPFTFDFAAADARVLDTQGNKVAGFDRFEGNFNPFMSLFETGFHFGKGHLYAPVADVIRKEDGAVNLLQLQKPDPDDAPAPTRTIQRLPRLVVEDLLITDADVTITDRVPGETFQKQITALTFTVDRLDTRPEHENEHSLSIELASGESIEWTGSTFADPLTATGVITIFGVDLAPFMPYVSPYADLVITDGVLSIEATYDVAPVAEPRRAAVTLTSAAVDSLRIRTADNEVVAVERIALSDLIADADDQRLTIADITIASPTLHIRRNEQGALELLEALKLNAPATQPDSANAPTPAASADPGARTADASPPAGPASPNASVDAEIEAPVERLRVALQRLLEDALGPWSVELTRLQIRSGRIDLTDRAARSPVDVALADLNLTAGPVRTSEQYRTPFLIDARLNQQDAVELEGFASPLEARYEVTIVSDGLDLAWAAPYLPRNLPEPLPRADLRAARLKIDGRAALTGDTRAASDASWKGLVELLDVELADADTGETLLSAAQLAAEGDATAHGSVNRIDSLILEGAARARTLHASAPLRGPITAALESFDAHGAIEAAASDSEPLSITARGEGSAVNLTAQAPQLNSLDLSLARAVVGALDFSSADPTLSIAEILLESPRFKGVAPLLPSPIQAAADPAAESPGAQPAGNADASRALPSITLPFALRIDSLAIRDAALDIDNADTERPFAFNPDQITVDARSIRSDDETPAELAIEARLNQSARAAIKGQVAPFRDSPFLDLTVETESLSVKPYEPYTSIYLGYEIESGRTSLTLPVKIEEGRLEGRLDARLLRFYLGDKVDSPAAPDAPIKLGLDLLRDRDDVIKLDVPFSGTLTDQSFRIGPIIQRAIVNTLGNVATAPFDAIGSIFASGRDIDLSRISFDPASTSLTPDAREALDVLAAALSDRPALRLSLTGHADRQTDAPPLRAGRLDELLLERLRAQRPAAAALDEESRRDMIESLYEDTFPDRVARRAPAPLGARDQPAPTIAEKERALLASVEITDERLRELARARADNAAAEIRRAAAVDLGERLTIADPVLDPDETPSGVVFDLTSD